MTTEMATEKQISFLTDLINRRTTWINSKIDEWIELDGPNSRLAVKFAPMRDLWAAIEIPASLSKAAASRAIDRMKLSCDINDLAGCYEKLMVILNS